MARHRHWGSVVQQPGKEPFGGEMPAIVRRSAQHSLAGGAGQKEVLSNVDPRDGPGGAWTTEGEAVESGLELFVGQQAQASRAEAYTITHGQIPALLWRRGRDSNPRRVAPYTISNRAHSTGLCDLSERPDYTMRRSSPKSMYAQRSHL